ncbi:hypothetical protein ACWDR0_27600 [Streptomyces sp. NPDC003691]
MTLPDPNQQPGGAPDPQPGPRPEYPPGPRPDPGPAAVPGEPEYQWGPDTPPGTPAYGYPGPGYGYPGPYGYDPTLPGYGLTQPGLAVPPGAAAAGAGMPLVTIGDITVTHDTIVTPSGNMPLRGAVWTATDLSRTEEKIAPYAIALAVVLGLFTCLMSLLFLLIKEKKTSGYIQVTVTSGGLHHTTMVPAYNAHTFQHVMGQVNYARSISAI